MRLCVCSWANGYTEACGYQDSIGSVTVPASRVVDQMGITEVTLEDEGGPSPSPTDAQLSRRIEYQPHREDAAPERNMVSYIENRFNDTSMKLDADHSKQERSTSRDDFESKEGITVMGKVESRQAAEESRQAAEPVEESKTDVVRPFTEALVPLSVASVKREEEQSISTKKYSVSGKTLNQVPTIKRKHSKMHRRFTVDDRSPCKNYLQCMNSKAYNLFWFLSLVIALFGNGIAVLFNVPDDPGIVIVDIIMTCVAAFFVLDLVVKSLAQPYEYFLSFFFWMDIVGTVSMIFEVSYLMGESGKEQNLERVDPVFARSARAAKVGAKAGKFMKVLKCIEVVYGMKRNEGDAATMEAKILSAQLTLSLAKRVSILTVILVLCVPLFAIDRYPKEDLSLLMGVYHLEDEYKRAYDFFTSNPQATTTTIFSTEVNKFKDFYSNSDYFPFKLEGFPEVVTFVSSNGTQHQVNIPGASIINNAHADPDRKSNVKVQKVKDCLTFQAVRCSGDDKPSVSYDFETPNRLEGGLDIAVIFFIIIIMLFESFDLTQAVDVVLVKPMERMLGNAWFMAAIIMDQVEDDGLHFQNEIDMLELVMKKLATLAGVFIQQNIVTDGCFDALDDECKGTIVELMNQHIHEDLVRRSSMRSKVTNDDECIVLDMPFTPGEITCWSLDLLPLSAPDLAKLAVYLCFDSELRKACRTFIDSKTFVLFQEAVAAGYSENPYHNFRHAVDVSCSLARVLIAVHCTEWISDVDQFALMISALCHDIGHAGKTNPFLVETKHELALRYNDKSPLENMHCARLFEICRQPARNIFKKLHDESYKQARKVCISAILHTDNANHFDMVKDVQRIYTVCQEMCDIQQKDPDFLSSEYCEQVLVKETMLWLKLFLHFADIGNPLKPFLLNKSWAWLVQDEFFAQGDEERKLGIPVGMLNDREKVNRAGGEHGFIVFLVAPLVLAAAGVMPMLEPRATQLSSNLEDWKNFWVQSTNPSTEDIRKREADVKKVSDQVTQLTERDMATILAQRHAGKKKTGMFKKGKEGKDGSEDNHHGPDKRSSGGGIERRGSRDK